MLRRMPLALKISLVVALAVAVSTAALAATVMWAARTGFGRYLSADVTERTGELRPLLEDYYASQGSWSGVEQLMVQQSAGAPGTGHRGRMAPGTAELILTDADGNVEYGPPNAVSQGALARRVWRSGVPLTVDGQAVGYLVVQAGVEEDAFYGTMLTTILEVGSLAVLLAVGVGLILTRSALRPLRELEQATNKISAGDLGTRVPVRARDEVGALAGHFNDMASELQAQDTLRRRMMNDIAHELRTPLTVMQGQIEALQDGVFPLDSENLQPVHEQTLLLKRLVSDLRDLALAESGQIALDMAPMALDAVARRVVARFVPQAQTQGIDLETTASGPLPMIHGDAQRLEQVLNNLLSNALRHTPAGGRVAVALSAIPTGVRIAVQDTGEGIAPEDLPHIFERFFRSDQARQHDSGQTGLGLAIVRELIRAHGGEVRAESTAGQGTTITIDLPSRRAQT